MNKLQQTSMKS